MSQSGDGNSANPKGGSKSSSSQILVPAFSHSRMAWISGDIGRIRKANFVNRVETRWAACDSDRSEMQVVRALSSTEDAIESTVPEIEGGNTAKSDVAGPVQKRTRRGAFIDSQEHSGGWMASTAPTGLDALPLFTVAHHDYNAELDAAPSTRITELSLFNDEEIDALYKYLLAQIDQLDAVYARLLSHLSTASEISAETGSLMRECFFLQHNLAGQFEMLGMYRCANHSRRVESLLALFPPIHERYPQQLSEDATQQREYLWTSPLLLLQLIRTYQLHMKRESLPIPVHCSSAFLQEAITSSPHPQIHAIC